MVAYSANLKDEAATRKTMSVVKAASARVRPRSSRVGRDWTAVRMMDPHHTTPTTTNTTATVCSTVGCATIDSAVLVRPCRAT